MTLKQKYLSEPRVIEMRDGIRQDIEPGDLYLEMFDSDLRFSRNHQHDIVKIFNKPNNKQSVQDVAELLWERKGLYENSNMTLKERYLSEIRCIETRNGERSLVGPKDFYLKMFRDSDLQFVGVDPCYRSRDIVKIFKLIEDKDIMDLTNPIWERGGSSEVDTTLNVEGKEYTMSDLRQMFGKFFK